MLRALRHTLLRRRFNRLFVQPFAAETKRLRASHAAGVREAVARQRAFLHAALASARQTSLNATLRSERANAAGGSR